jgi:hypothetical protein
MLLLWNIGMVPRKERILCEQNQLLMNYSDEQLKQRYKFGRNRIMYLSDMSRDQI